MISVVLWDVEGTLVDHARSPREVLLGALAEAGVDPRRVTPAGIAASQREFAEHSLRWRSLEEEGAEWTRLAGVLLEGSGASEEQRARVAGAYGAYFDTYRLVPGVRAVLEEVAGRGLRQAVLSNWPPSLRRFLDHHDLTRFFAEIVVSAEEGVRKPERRIFETALARLGVAPAEAVLVGDDPANDLAPARALGIPVVHFNPRGEHPSADARDAAALSARLREVLG